MTRINVVGGDITQVDSDALITAVNSERMWFGGIDGAIQGVAGNMFHGQVSRNMPLRDCQAVYARAMDGFRGRFSSVIFVIDDLQSALRHVILAGLSEAENKGLSRVTLPTIRTGVMAGDFEPTVEAALDEMKVAITEFINTSPQYVQEITIVVFRDPNCESYLNRIFGLTNA